MVSTKCRPNERPPSGSTVKRCCVKPDTPLTTSPASAPWVSSHNSGCPLGPDGGGGVGRGPGAAFPSRGAKACIGHRSRRGGSDRVLPFADGAARASPRRRDGHGVLWHRRRGVVRRGADLWTFDCAAV